MPKEMQGRRIPVNDNSIDPYIMVKEPGDYYGPVVGLVDNPSVCFLLPIARDPDSHGGMRSLHHVQSPPHRFVEEPDGSLTIHDSIGAGMRGNYYWHGFLSKGYWKLA